MAATTNNIAAISNLYQTKLNRAPNMDELGYWNSTTGGNAWGDANTAAFNTAAAPEISGNQKAATEKWGWNYGDGSLGDVTKYYNGLGATDAERNSKITGLANGSVWHLNDGLISGSGGAFNRAKDLNAVGLGSGMVSQDAQQFLYDKAFAGVQANSSATRQANIDKYIASGMTPLQASEANMKDERDNEQRQLAWSQEQSAARGQGPGNGVARADIQPWQVTPDQTVQGQMQGLLSQDNPLVQMAKTQGLENAQQRGLLNSSLGAEAGALAHYQYAMPIAQADAATYGSAAQTNAQNQTQANIVAATAENSMSQLAFNAKNSVELANLNAKNELARLDKANANAMAQLDSQQANALRTNYIGNMDTLNRTYMNQVNAIQLADMDPEAKSGQIRQLQTVFNDSVSYYGTMYGNMPAWAKAYALLPATIG